VHFLKGAKLWGMTNADFKAKLIRDMEGEIDGLLKAREGGKRLTLTEIEDVVLEARQRLGQRMVEGMIEQQESESRAGAPISAISGKRMQQKGKKNKRSRHD
jgi:hypothetical protein